MTSLSKRCWYNKLIFFYNIVNGLLPDYLQSFIEIPSQGKYPLRLVSAGKLNLHQKALIKLFFPYCIDERNKLNSEVRNAKSMNKFKKSIKIENLENSLYHVQDPLGLKLLSCLRFQFSHSNKNKFRYGFNDTINSMCACGTEHFFQ